MNWLGHVIWWSVGAPEVRTDEVAEILDDLEMDIAPPNPIVPIDAFRRLTGGTRHEYRLENGDEVTLDLHPAKSQRTMVNRVIVRTVRREGIAVAIDRVGDCAFYKPPRGQNHRARMRVTIFPAELPDTPQIERFGEGLRQEYRRALDVLDPQALRRLVRQFLAASNAVLVGRGPYFLPDLHHAECLANLLERLGGGSTCNIIPVVNDEPRRKMVSDALEAAVTDGEAALPLVEAYVPLGVVPEAVWALLEKEEADDSSS